jgi:hypothetical protein
VLLTGPFGGLTFGGLTEDVREFLLGLGNLNERELGARHGAARLAGGAVVGTRW